MTTDTLAPPAPPRIGFVSLGCPKALTDSELILTQLSAEGYATSKTFAGADLVIVNTCGFIDDAVKESLDTIGEALAANGRVIVTGCLGAKAGEGGAGNLVRQMHPRVLAVTGPHAHPDVLKRMKRPASGEKNLDRLQRWRELCPQIVVRNTFIAGFPGETEAEFDYLLDFMREAQIDRAGCFAYSPVGSASANALPGALPAKVREERRARFMAVVEQVSTQKLHRRVGATMQVPIDSAPALGRKGGAGRSYTDAPEIDGSVRLLPPEKASKQLRTGEFTRAGIVPTQGHDLAALPI